jgi:hypothetical protein
MRMKLVRIIIAIILGSACLLAGGGYFHLKAMKRAAKYNAYVTLTKACQDMKKYGVATNSLPAGAQVYPCTNRFSIQGTNYDCVLGLTWPTFSSNETVMAITGNGSVICLEGRDAPRLIKFDPMSPF